MATEQETKQTLIKILSESYLNPRQEFLDAFKKILDYLIVLENKLIQKIDNKTNEEIEKLESQMSLMKKDIGTILRQAETDNISTFAGFKRKTMEVINQFFAKHEINRKVEEWQTAIDNKLEMIDAKLGQMKDGIDGKNADENKIISDIIKKMEDKEFAIDNIKGLAKELEDLRAIKTRVRGGGVSAMGVAQAFKQILKTEQPSGTINGVNTAFTVSYPIFAILAFSLNGESIAELPNYTVSNKTITFSTAIPAAYSGKDFEVKYISY